MCPLPFFLGLHFDQIFMKPCPKRVNAPGREASSLPSSEKAAVVAEFAVPTLVSDDVASFGCGEDEVLLSTTTASLLRCFLALEACDALLVFVFSSRAVSSDFSASLEVDKDEAFLDSLFDFRLLLLLLLLFSFADTAVL